MKVWIIILKDGDARQKLRAYSKREDAVTEMQSLHKHYTDNMRHTYVGLSEIDGLLVMSLEDGEGLRYEEAVMTELTVDGFEIKKIKSKPGILDNGWHLEPDFL